MVTFLLREMSFLNELLINLRCLYLTILRFVDFLYYHYYRIIYKCIYKDFNFEYLII